MNAYSEGKLADKQRFLAEQYAGGANPNVPPLSDRARMLLEQLRMAQASLDTLQHGPQPDRLGAATELEPVGLQHALESAMKVASELRERLQVLEMQIGRL